MHKIKNKICFLYAGCLTHVARTNCCGVMHLIQNVRLAKISKYCDLASILQETFKTFLMPSSAPTNLFSGYDNITPFRAKMCLICTSVIAKYYYET